MSELDKLGWLMQANFVIIIIYLMYLDAKIDKIKDKLGITKEQGKING